MLRKILTIISLIGLLLSTVLAGCGAVDFFCPLSQDTTLEVIVNGNGAATDATVTFATKPTSPWFNLSDEEYLDQLGFSATTNENGQVLLTDSYEIWCSGGLFPILVRPASYPDPLPDLVSGTVYLVRIATDSATEILTVEFTPNNTVTGEIFEVTVVSIGQAIPLDYEDYEPSGWR